MSTTTAPTAGDFFQRWRKARRLSQLELAVAAGVSQRHLSFLETGRSSPSREMIIHLAIELDVPLRERNMWLNAAGYVDVYTEGGLDEPAMSQIRHVLEIILNAYRPFPAYVVDRAWNLMMTNPPAQALTAMLIAPPLFEGNILRLLMHPEGLRLHIANWEQAATALMHRLHREMTERPSNSTLVAFLNDVHTYPGVAELSQGQDLPVASDSTSRRTLATGPS